MAADTAARVDIAVSHPRDGRMLVTSPHFFADPTAWDAARRGGMLLRGQRLSVADYVMVTGRTLGATVIGGASVGFALAGVHVRSTRV
jgi:hypothetical protein